MSERRVLIVDNTDLQRQFLREVTEQFLIGWKIVDVSSAEEARSYINAGLVIAIVDLFLRVPPRQGKGDGIDLLHEIREAVPACLNILVSYHAKNRMESQLDDESAKWVDEFVSLRYVDTDPAAALMDALSKAERLVCHA